MSVRPRYRAFISYSHADKKWADWLQRRLESFRDPSSVRLPFTGKRVLAPIFRDRSDFSSSPDLSASAREALEDSDALIVICSPAAAQSKWVNEEILTFKKIGRSARIFPIIVDGEPFADELDKDCFPQALKYRVDDFGELTDDAVEPLGADVRPAADGKADAALKIIAGLLEVPFDQLRRRQQSRRNRQLLLASCGSLVVASAMTALAISAYFARQDAELRRTQAEGLIGFMLGDLRQRLEPVGRLDVLEQVGNRAMAYFESLPADEFNQDASLPRAMALRQIGEVRNAQGQTDAAAQSFLESQRILRLANTRQPNDPEVMFELAQSHFWVANIYFSQNDFAAAKEEITQYRNIAETLFRAHPNNESYKLEFAYAASNLATIDFNTGDYQSARVGFLDTLEIVEELVANNPQDRSLIEELAGTYSWLGSTQLKLHELNSSLATHQRLLALMRRVATETDKNSLRRLGDGLSVLAGDYYRLGMTEAAVVSNAEAVEIFTGLVQHDPSNVIWRGRLAAAESALAQAYLVQGNFEAAGDLLRKAQAMLVQVRASADNADTQNKWMTHQLLMGSYLAQTKQNAAAIGLLVGLTTELGAQLQKKGLARDARFFAAGSYLLADTQLGMGDVKDAHQTALTALQLLADFDSPEIDLFASVFALKHLAGLDYDEMLADLKATHFSQPEYWAHSPAAMVLSESR